MTKPYNYETFLRTAFGFGTTGVTLDRYGDPAGIANTDCFGERLIHIVKAGTAYAMLIMTRAIVNEKGMSLPDDENRRFDEFVENVIDAENTNEIDALITEFKSTVIDRYFDGYDGRLRLKE